MRRRSTTAVLTALLLSVGGIAVGASATAIDAVPGAPGIGDPYYPKAGNGGYDAEHYTLDLTYRPGANRLAGVATMHATAIQNLSRFNLDLDGLRVLSVQVDGRSADWSRNGGELRIRPARHLRVGELFTTVVSYGGVPQTLPDGSGFFHTSDGALVVGEPEVAATWFPVNDHPSDKASYTFRVTSPRGRPVVANGELIGHRTVDGWTTWHWEAREPMASYLATASVGRWNLRQYRHRDIEMVDAIDPKLFKPFAVPRRGDQLLKSSPANSAYQRLMRTISVPEEGAMLSFSVDLRTEPTWDFFTVEAHTVGTNDWTTLKDQRGHTRRYPGSGCPFWLDLHPFLAHYMAPGPEDGCVPKGSTGRWHAATGNSGDYQRWSVDLSRYAGTDVEVSLTMVSDDLVAFPGVFIDDVRVSTGDGTTSFEADGNVFDGWHAAPPPQGSSDSSGWQVADASEVPSLGSNARRSFDRQGEILDFLAGFFGPYPFSASGGIVDHEPSLHFALENQTRPIYAQSFFFDTAQGDSVVVHELAHQWYGDSLSVQKWRHIWLNEGFATYAEWMWSEREGAETPAEIFDNFYKGIPKKDPFWDITIGDPGPQLDRLFHFAVYARGAMTLQQLRVRVGDEDFFTILERWATKHRNGNVRTGQFIGMSERVSGQQLDRLFHKWLFTSGRPELTDAAADPARGRASSGGEAAKLLRSSQRH